MFSPKPDDQAIRASLHSTPGKRDRSKRKPSVPRTPRGDNLKQDFIPSTEELISNFDKKILFTGDSKSDKPTAKNSRHNTGPRKNVNHNRPAKLSLKELYEESPLKVYSPDSHLGDWVQDRPIFAPERSPYPFDDGTILINPYFNKNLHSEGNLRKWPDVS